MRRDLGNRVQRPLTPLPKSQNVRFAILPTAIDPSTIPEIAMPARARQARPKWVTQGPMLTDKADTDRADTTPACRAAAVVAVAVARVEDTAISSKVLRNVGREGDIFSNTANAGDGRAVGKWGRLSPGVRMCRAPMDKR
jgi:hypothetical protein